MQEIIQQIIDKTGITQEQAATALKTIQEYFTSSNAQSTNTPTQESGNAGFFENLKDKAEALFEKANESGLVQKAEEAFENIKNKF